MSTRTIRFAFTLFALAVSLVAGTASGQPLSQGTLEVAPSLAFSHNGFSVDGNEAGSIGLLAIDLFLGHCITDRVEIGGNLMVTHQTFDDPTFGSVSGTTFGVAGGVQFNFVGEGNVVPFIRGAVGIGTNSGDLAAGEETTIIAPILAAGIRVLVGNSASVNMGAGYQHQSNALGVSDLSANTFSLQIGVSIFPGHNP